MNDLLFAFSLVASGVLGWHAMGWFHRRDDRTRSQEERQLDDALDRLEEVAGKERMSGVMDLAARRAAGLLQAYRVPVDNHARVREIEVAAIWSVIGDLEKEGGEA